MQLSVHWCQPLIVFGHALLILRIKHGQVDSGYAGACRPDREVTTVLKCEVDLQKWKQQLGTWKQLLCRELQHTAEENKDNPPAV